MYFLIVMLVAFSLHTSAAVPHNVPLAEMPNVTYSMLAEIDTTVQRMNNEAAKFVPQVQELLQKLNSSAIRGMSEMDSSLKSTASSFQSDIAKLLASAKGTNTKPCEGFLASVPSAVLETMRTVESCVNDVLNEANQRIALTLNYLDTRLDELTKAQKKAGKCIENTNLTDSNETEIRKTYSCVKQGKSEADYSEEMISSTADFTTATVLHRGWSNRIGCCTTMSEAESFKYALELHYSDVETCLSNLVAQ